MTEKQGCPGMLWRLHSKSRFKVPGPNSPNSARRDEYLKMSLTWVKMDRRYVYRSVREESSAVVLVQVQYNIYSHKLPSHKTAPVKRPRDTPAICVLLCKKHSSVSVIVLVRGAAVGFRPPPVLYRMGIASPGSFASLGCTTASAKTCFYWSHNRSLALELSPTARPLARSWPLHSAWALHAQGNWMLEAGGTNCYKF